MAWTGYQMFLAGLLIVTGSINTLATKWADETEATGRDGGRWKNRTGDYPTSIEHPFNHPFLQAVIMFIGEFSCLVFFKIMLYIHTNRKTPDAELPDMLKGNREFNPLIFLAPAMCDMVATSLMYIGLNMTYPASFQMFRGAVIIFTGIFSMLFLKRKLFVYKWIGILCVLAGLSVVGAADFTSKDDSVKYDSQSVITGDLLIVLAQVISATQMVLEEKFVSQSNVPALQAVGWEGLFGMSVLGVVLVPMYFIKPSANVPIEDAIDAFVQIGHNAEIAAGLGGTLLSISFFNFAGISVTKEMSATTRMVLDSVRTVIVWCVAMLIKSWDQKFHYLTLIGFVILLLGTAVYNNILFLPFMIRKGWIKDPEEDSNDDSRRLGSDEEDA